MKKYLIPFLLLFIACHTNSQTASKSIEGLYEVNKIIMNKDEIPLDDNLLCVMLAMETEFLGYLTLTKKKMLLSKEAKVNTVDFIKNGLEIIILDHDKKTKLGTITGSKMNLFSKNGKNTSELTATKTTGNI